MPADLIGSTPAVWLPTSASPRKVTPGESYFIVSVRSAQAVFKGRFWENAQRVLVISKVSMNHPALGTEPAVRIDCAREIRSGHAVQLGIARELISLTPATMDRVSIVFEFMVDKQNRLAPVVNLINDSSLLSVVSLSPAVVGAVKAVTKLSTKVLETFLPFEDRTPVLQFTGDFNLTTGQLREGYFAILASTENGVPLPTDLAGLKFEEGVLSWRDAVITDWSYVVFSVDVVPRRTRDLGTGPWVALLNQAEGEADRIAEDPFVAMPEREKAWRNFMEYIGQARTLLLEDPLYLRTEVKEIVADAFVAARAKILADGALRAPGAELDEFSMRMLGVASSNELGNIVGLYRNVSGQSREELRALGLLT